MLRLQVEHAAGSGMLDMTWARVRRIIVNLPLYNHLQSGKPYNQAPPTFGG